MWSHLGIFIYNFYLLLLREMKLHSFKNVVFDARSFGEDWEGRRRERKICVVTTHMQTFSYVIIYHNSKKDQEKCTKGMRNCHFIKFLKKGSY